MASPMMLQRYAPLVSGILGLVGLSVSASAVDMVAAIGNLKSPRLEQRLRSGFGRLSASVEHARNQAGDEAVAVESLVATRVTASRMRIMRAALLGCDEFSRAVTAAGVEGFGDSARHYLDVLLPEVHRIVHDFAVSPETFPELGASVLADLSKAYSDVARDVEALRKGQVTQEMLDLLGEKLRAEMDRRPQQIVDGARPQLVPHFVDRAEQSRVREVLSDAGTATLCAVAGMRGVGKSQVAAWFAEECVNNGWGFVGWVVASSRAETVTGMARIARANKIAPRDSDEDEAASRLVAWLSGSGPDPRLLVFDNVESADDLKGLIPSGPGMRVLVTTTSHADALGKRIELSVFAPEQAVDYLTTAAGNPDHDGAALVCEDLGHLPLALTQAATTIRLRGYTYAEYRKDLDEQQQLDKAMRRPQGQDYPLMVGAALWLAFDTVTRRLGKEDPAVEEASIAVLDAVSLLAEQGVPRDWLYEAADDHTACREATSSRAAS